jgi:hypothetical protein
MYEFERTGWYRSETRLIKRMGQLSAEGWIFIFMLKSGSGQIEAYFQRRIKRPKKPTK